MEARSLYFCWCILVISLIVGYFWCSWGYFAVKLCLIMWLVNIIWSIPTLLLVIAITLALGKDFGKFFCSWFNDVGRSGSVEVKLLASKKCNM
jgi:ABC-type dipeptide/oligopeptide/nickel transport system permease subunit